MEQALRDESEQLLTLPDAAEISGYHPDSLARMVRDGQIPDLRPPNSKGMIRIRRADLPIKPGWGLFFLAPSEERQRAASKAVSSGKGRDSLARSARRAARARVRIALCACGGTLR